MITERIVSGYTTLLGKQAGSESSLKGSTPFFSAIMVEITSGYVNPFRKRTGVKAPLEFDSLFYRSYYDYS